MLIDKGFTALHSFQYFNTGANLGGAGGFKFGLKASLAYECDNVWLMDDDIEAENDCLEKLISTSFSSSGIIQPSRYYLDGEFFSYDYKDFNFDNPFKEFKQNRITNDDVKHNKMVQMASVPFEGPLIPFKIVKDIGAINSDYFLIGDDTDYSIRAKNAGYNIYLLRDARLKRLIKPVIGKEMSWKVFFFYRNVTLIDKFYAKKYVLYIRSFMRILRYTGSYLKGNKTKINLKAMIDGVLSAYKPEINNDIHELKKKYVDK